MNHNLPFITLVSSGNKNSGGNTDSVDLTRFFKQGILPAMLRVQLNIVSVSGTATPTLNVFIEDSVDGLTYNTIGQIITQTTVGRNVINIGLRGDAQPTGFAWPFNYKKIRARWTMSGNSPNFNFDVIALIL